VRNVVICPGSRSTPLALAFIERVDRIRPWVLYDERSAAFFALGMARSSALPVALLCTSGTAAANFVPAVAEASLGRVAVVAVTADRPPESRDFGGAQTIDQVELFTTHVKWAQDMPVAADLDSLIRYARRVGLRAADAAKSTPKGPVHVNFPFREPLVADRKTVPHEQSTAPVLTVVGPTGRADEGEIRPVAGRLRTVMKGAIVVGPGEYTPATRGQLSRLSELLGWPVLADVLSNLRQDGALCSGLVRCYEPLVRSEGFRSSMKLDYVVRVGGVPTSKELNSFCQGAETLLIDEGNEWRDPEFAASTMIFGDLEHTVSCLNRGLEEVEMTTTAITTTAAAASAVPTVARAEAGNADKKSWLERWLDADAGVQAKMQALMGATAATADELFEGKLFYLLSTELTPSEPLTVVVGSSMPVRDLDSFFPRGSENVRFVANRGANGIDGVVSTAMGVAAAEGDVLLILGDVSFYHDMNGLLASKLQKLNAMIIVINNRGGGIFSFLAQHGLPPHVFEQLFGEAHDLDFSGVRLIYGGDFVRVSDWPSFKSAFADYTRRKGLRVMEFTAPDRERNLELHKRAFDILSPPPAPVGEEPGRKDEEGAG
jgi:2-succinyl-5-enolpyruvyl-6-hydroxy-3-cyclohexene-1-carboxylate synthase